MILCMMMNQIIYWNLWKVSSDISKLISDDTLHDDESDNLLESLELVSRLTFTSWDEFKNWLDRFALKEGFNHKIRTSEKDQGIIRRPTYECTKSGSHNPQVTSDPTKCCNACSSQLLCPWKLNVTCPKKSGIVKINSFNNHH